MSDEQKLDWLKKYEQQNPAKYLMKFGKVIGHIPQGQPFAGQPNKWEYVAPEEAIKAIVPSFMASTAIKVEISQKKEVTEELGFTDPISGISEEASVPKRGRKPKNV